MQPRVGRRAQTTTARAARPSDTPRRHRPDYQIVLFMGLLMLFGLIIMYAIGPQRANVLNNSYGTDFYTDTYFFVKQVTSLAVALAAFTAMAFIPYKLVLQHSRKVLFVGLGACALLAVAAAAGWGIAQESLGATRWFDIPGFGSLQPAEILKFGVLVFVASFLGAKVKQGKVNDLKESILPIVAIAGVAGLLVVVIQKDMGTGLALIGIILSMLLVSGLRTKYVGAALGIIVALGLVTVVMAPHRLARIATFVQGDSASIEDAGSYHIEHAKIAIGTGGLFGVGIGKSVQATGYLPEAINDSVFAIMGETFGFVGLLTIMGLFTALLFRLLRVMDHLVDPQMRLVVAGVFGWLAAHVMLNIAAMIGLVPLTGITLPLLSFGGTSMLFIAAALGLVFQLSRYTVHGARLKEMTQHEDSGSRRRVGRTRYTSRRSS